MKRKHLWMLICAVFIVICAGGVMRGSEFSMVGVISWSFILGCLFQSWADE